MFESSRPKRYGSKTIEITEIDAKILKDLLKDGRKSFTDIAEECGETKSTIWKHYRQLEGAGVITGSTIQMNYAAFGYYAVGTIEFKVDPKEVNHAVEYARKIPDVHSAWQLGKSSNIFVVATLKDIERLNWVKETLKTLPSASRVITSVWTGIRNIPENLTIIPIKQGMPESDASFANSVGKVPKQDCRIDQLDIKIVDELSKNGHKSFKKIAIEINSSSNTVARRFEKLKENNIIKVTIQINPLKLGYGAIALFNVAFSTKNGISSVVDRISKIPDVTLILKTSGAYDLAAGATIRDVDQLLDTQDTITAMEGVTEVESSVSRIGSVMPAPREYISTF